jgi:hypothetical protein
MHDEKDDINGTEIQVAERKILHTRYNSKVWSTYRGGELYPYHSYLADRPQDYTTEITHAIDDGTTDRFP